MNLAGVIFDFNGVLLWDAPLHVEAWQESALVLRGQAFTEQEFALHVHGRTNNYILAYLTGTVLDSDEEARLIQVKESAYRELCINLGAEFTLSPGAAKLLDYLSEHGTPMTIATASEESNVDFFFEHLELSRWFERHRVIYDNGLLAGKPAPDMYLAAAQSIGLDPDLCIVVEDAISGLAAACAAGIGYVIALGPVEKHARFRECDGVREIVENLGSFPRWRLQESSGR